MAFVQKLTELASSSVMVAMFVPKARVAFVRPLRMRRKVSLPSCKASSETTSVMVLVVTPGAKDSVPFVDV